MKDIGTRVEGNLETTEDKVADQKKRIEKLRIKLQKKEEAKCAVTIELDEVKRLIV